VVQTQAEQPKNQSMLTIYVKRDFLRPEGDINGDEKIGLEEAIYALQKVAGLQRDLPRL